VGARRLLGERFLYLFVLWLSLLVFKWLEVVVLGARFSDSSIIVDSVILDRVVGKQLALCPYLKRKPLSLESSKAFPNCWNLCSLISDHCDFHGVRLKFSSYGIDSLRISWVCPRIVDLSFLRSDTHG
jgi:hypothetical protein